MKSCYCCLVEKPDELFVSKKYGRPYCKDCSNAKALRSYYRNLEKRRADQRGKKKPKRIKFAKAVNAIKSQSRGCVICGDTDIRLLSFCHGDHAKGRQNVSTLVASAKTWEQIEAEIAKCQLLCRNCHRYVTAKSKNFYALGLGQRAPSNASEERKAEVQRNIIKYLAYHPCTDCQEDRFEVLEFDHRPDVEKISEIANMVSRVRPWPEVLAEIRKCDVRCANCHLKVTASRANWIMHTEVANG